MPRFSIVTPSFRGGCWLPLCIASVADQGIEVEHLVQDAGSDDGTLEWLLKDQRVHAYVEQDSGMYDALNRGFDRARGEFLAYLNCDEQYLPGALRAAAGFFDAHPGVDVVFGHLILAGSEGQYLSHRKVQTPRLRHTWVSHLSTLSCAMFFRRSLVSERGLRFDPRWRAGGDAEWMVRLLKSRIRMGVLDCFTSVFTHTEANLSASEQAREENAALRASAPFFTRKLKPLIVLHHRLRRLFGGMYRQPPFHYDIYTVASPRKRARFEVQRPSFRWPTN